MNIQLRKIGGLARPFTTLIMHALRRNSDFRVDRGETALLPLSCVCLWLEEVQIISKRL